MSILEVIQRSADFLAKKGVSTPRLQVELLLAHVLRMPRMKLYLNFDRALTDSELDALRLLVQRRGQREPLQYITGSACFCGLDLTVNPHVLIPRPETELLAERGWKFLQGRTGETTALDLGAGSGCLAIALAANATAARIHATDISADALDIARQNASRCGVSARVEFHQGDLFAGAPRNLLCDLIVSNPPYIPTARIATLEPEVRDFEPRGALDGGADGLDFYRAIAARAQKFLAPEGRLMLELDEEGAAAARDIFLQENWRVEPLQMDDAGQPRILIAHLESGSHDGASQGNAD